MLNQNKDNQLALIQEPFIIQPRIPQTNNSIKLETIIRRLKTVFIFGLSLSIILFVVSVGYIMVTQGSGSDSYIYLSKSSLDKKKFIDLSDVIATASKIPDIDPEPSEVELDDSDIINANLITPKPTIQQPQSSSSSIPSSKSEEISSSLVTSSSSSSTSSSIISSPTIIMPPKSTSNPQSSSSEPITSSSTSSSSSNSSNLPIISSTPAK